VARTPWEGTPGHDRSSREDSGQEEPFLDPEGGEGGTPAAYQGWEHLLAGTAGGPGAPLVYRRGGHHSGPWVSPYCYPLAPCPSLRAFNPGSLQWGWAAGGELDGWGE